ncbi:MAG: hypothetical protein AB7S26_32900 [Sandaracinaceae bacterium]
MVSLVGCAPSRAEVAAERALDYLERTDDELGLDVVAAIQIYAAEKGDARAAEVAEARRAGLAPSEVARWGRLLTLDKPPLTAEVLDPSAASASHAGPADDLMDDRVVACVDEALACALSDRCREFVELEGRGGYVLTHQAFALLLTSWGGCDASWDEGARRRTLAADLAFEVAMDPGPSDLANERLAMLASLGFASAIEPAWIQALLDAQREEGCFEPSPGAGCHPHPTGLALWALGHR